MATTNFFQALSAFQAEGNWVITIKAAAQSRMLVSVLFSSDKTGDAAHKLIPPLILKGTATELDNGFFDAIETPVKKTVSLLVNMDAYIKAQETARLASKMETDKKQKESKQKDSGDKKFEAQMKKVEELEEAGKFREAYGQLPKVDDYPDHEEAINEKKEQLGEQFDQTGLFANA